MLHLYFQTASNIDEAKGEYKALYIANFSNAEVMANINLQFTAFKKAYEIGVIQPNTQPEEITGTVSHDIETWAKLAAKIQGCTVEVCGNWIWVKCDKDNVLAHENLKANKFRFSGAKKAWYYTNAPFKKRRGSKTYTQIKNKYGVEEIV